MPTSYTSLLGLALPATGELQGTWGTTVNDAITSLLDTAVAGTTTLNTDADVTLSTTTGAANQARQAVILWTANGTTTRNITAPAQSKSYIVINSSAGTQSIVIRGVGPTTGVTVVKGEKALVAWNGSDFVKIATDNGTGTFTDVNVSGTTTLSGLTASTALALNASKQVVSVTNTGTGDNVLATSPSLTTPTLGVASATSINKVAITAPATSATLTIADGKTLTANNSLTLAGTDSTTMTFPSANATLAGLGITQTFTALQTFSGSTSVAAALLTNAKEIATVSATAATGTINYDVTTQSVLYYTTNASANWTVNFRGSSGTSLNTLMATGECITVAFLVTQGSTAYYNSAVQVDGNSVTPKWQGGTAPTAGNASGVDVYTYTIVKTGSAAFTVFAAQVQFA